MFDVFQNVLFGKKKSNAESEKEKQSEGEDFVVIGQTSNDQSSVKEPETNSLDPRFLPKHPYGTNLLNENMPTSSAKSEETYFQIMPLQDVPFTINSSLSASAKLDQIWANMSSIFSSVSQYKPYQEDYDFSLEKSVISETVQK